MTDETPRVLFILQRRWSVAEVQALDAGARPVYVLATPTAA